VKNDFDIQVFKATDSDLTRLGGAIPWDENYMRIQGQHKTNYGRVLLFCFKAESTSIAVLINKDLKMFRAEIKKKMSKKQLKVFAIKFAHRVATSKIQEVKA